MLLNNASACGQPATLGNGSISPVVGARSPRFSRAFARHDPRNFSVAVGVGRLPMRALLHHPFCAQCFARISGTRARMDNRGNPRRAWISSTPVGYAEIRVQCGSPLMEAFARTPEIHAKHYARQCVPRWHCRPTRLRSQCVPLCQWWRSCWHWSNQAPNPPISQ